MKNIIILLVCICSYAAHAQFIIPKVGVTYSTVASEDNDGIDPIIGFSVGLGYSFRINKLISIQPELNFLQKGYSYDDTYDNFQYGGGFYKATYNEDNKMNYLQLPILAKITVGKFYFNAGPSIGLGINGKGNYKYSEVGEDRFGEAYEYKDDGKYDIIFKKVPDGYEGRDTYIENRMNFSLQVGAGVTLMDKINIEVRYGHGLSDLFDYAKSQHSVWQVTVGVPIKL